MTRKPTAGLQHTTLFTHFDPNDCWLFIKYKVHLQGLNISGHQSCSGKCYSSAQGYSKRGVPYMVLTVAALLKQSTLKVTPLIMFYVYRKVCSNNIQEHYSQILHKHVCYILISILSTSDLLHMLALFFTLGNSSVYFLSLP